MKPMTGFHTSPDKPGSLQAPDVGARADTCGDLRAIPALRPARLGRAGGADRDDQARAGRGGKMADGGAVQPPARRVSGAARAGSARAVRPPRNDEARPAWRNPSRAGVHASGPVADPGAGLDLSAAR